MRKQTFKTNLANDLEKGASWLTKKWDDDSPKALPLFEERRADKKDKLVKLSHCCLFGIYFVFGFKSCLGHLSRARAGQFCLSSFPTFALNAEKSPSTQKLCSQR